jgi:Protein of unknown function (DUF2490)
MHVAVSPCLSCAIVWILSAGTGALASPGQDDNAEFRPELDIYARLGPMVRIEFVNFVRGNLTTDDWQASPTFYVETALKPVFRRGLREQPDVYRNRYLTFRAGYLHRTGLTAGDSGSENRGILELTSRYLLPGQLVISDRNRADLRFIKNQPFSARYRNRLRLERDFQVGRFECTPYGSVEAFYDTRSGQWTSVQFTFGAQFPVGPHVVLEPYYLRGNTIDSVSPHLDAAGFKFSLYF